MIRELRLLLPYLRRYRLRFLLGAACIFGSVMLKIVIPHLLGESIDLLRDMGASAEAATVPAAEGRRLLLRGALAILAAAAATAVVRTASRLTLLGTSRRVVHDLRTDLFDRLAELSPSFYARRQTGDLQSRAVNDAQYVQGLAGPVFLYITETVALYAIGLVFMLRISPGLTAAALLPMPLFVFTARRLATRIQTGARAAQEGLAEITAKVDESLSGQMVIKSLALEDFDLARFAARSGEYRERNLAVTRARALLQPMMVALGSLSTLVVLAIGGPMVVSGTISLGEFVAMILYLQMVVAPTGALGFVISSLRRGAAALGRVRGILDAEPGLGDPEEPDASPLRGGALEVRGLTVHLTAEGGGERTVLQDVSFTVAAGTTLGVVGRTGAGKTTLLRALARQLEVEPGQIFVDGVDVMDRPLRALRREIGYVPQETFLFSASLAENIALGEPGASRERLVRVARAAQLEKDLDQLPAGLDTLIGERGVNLSGGQRQRTALARVMLLQPSLLLLDDTLSAVDSHTAEEILAELRPLMEGRTTVIVSHRVAVVSDAEQILVLDDGRIAEHGDHARLVAHNGIYADLHRKQQTREALAAEIGVDPEERA